MQIAVQPEKIQCDAGDLLRLSQSLRRLLRETEDVGSRLRTSSELEGCRRKLAEQEEDLTRIIARLVSLSAALQQISLQYRNSENDCLDLLEDPCEATGPGATHFWFLGDQYRERLDGILRRAS